MTAIDRFEEALWSACVLKNYVRDEQQAATWDQDEFLYLKEGFSVLPLPGDLEPIKEEALAQWEQILNPYLHSLGLTPEGMIDEFTAGLKRYQDKLLRTERFRSMCAKAYGLVKNLDWVNAFAWILPRATGLDEGCMKAGKLMAAVFYMENIHKFWDDPANTHIKRIDARWRLANQLHSMYK